MTGENSSNILTSLSLTGKIASKKSKMKQPDLGKKISELRKAKGWTQEELVEKCNISVRTIQRIETGEVTPRSYTVKTILTALDFDAEKIFDVDLEKAARPWLKELLLRGVDANTPDDFLVKHLHIAWILGIIYFILRFPEGIIEYSRFNDNELPVSVPVYVSLKICLLISFILFQRGFILIAALFDNYLLKIVSFILMGVTLLLFGYDIVSIVDDHNTTVILVVAAVLYGAVGIIYAISLRRLGRQLGFVAKSAAAIELITAFFLLTIFLAFIGDFIHIAAELCEIIIIFKVIEMIRKKDQQENET
jgi:transcriptional regulator with XRE-family HTH domain